MKMLKLIALSMLLISPLSFAAALPGRYVGPSGNLPPLVLPQEQKQKEIKVLQRLLEDLQGRLSKANSKDKKSIKKEIERIKKALAELEPSKTV